MYPKRIPKHLIFDPQPKRKSKAWLWWLVILLVAATVTLLSLEARADIPKLDNATVQAGQLSLVSQAGQPLPSVHLVTNVTATINGLVVTTDYVQRFRNDSDQWAEGIYVFPLPPMAAIQHMEMLVGERRITGQIKERDTAEVIYRQAKSQGQRAAITTQQRDNLFTQKVANIAPHQSIEVRLTFIDTANYQNGMFEWRLPTTLTPRFIPGISLPTNQTGMSPPTAMSTNPFGWALATDQVPDAPHITPMMTMAATHGIQNPLQLSISLQSGIPLASVESLYHEMDVLKQQKGYQIVLHDGIVEMDRDVVLQWSPTASSQPRAAIFQQPMGDDTYAMLMMIPPTVKTQQALDKDIMFVIDVSGSMQGQSIAQAKASLSLAIEQLSPNDRFNIIAFSDTPLLFNDRLILAGGDLKQIAQHWVSSLQADGGTQMYPALQAAYAQMFDPSRLQQIVFITDGAIGNEEMLFDLINTPEHNARLFTVGIGSAPNTFFMHKAAQLGRGSYELISTTHDVQRKMSRLFAKLNHVAATNIAIDWPDAAEYYPSRSADLFDSETLLSFAKLSHPVQSLQVQGDTAEHHWNTTIQSNNAAATTGIGALWARQKVADIEDQGRSGILSSESVRDAVLDIALAHSLLTRFTAFVAVEEISVRTQDSPLDSHPIANVMPDGSARQAVMFANTATSATLTFWLGIAGCVLLLWQRTAKRAAR